MPIKITVRDAVELDAPAISSITREAFLKYRHDLSGGVPVKALSESEEVVLKDIKTKRVLVAEMDGEPVGCCRFEALPSGIAYFSRFGVLLRAQSLGVGGMLVGRVVEQCSGLQIPAIALHTSARMSSLIRFYYGKGFFVHSINTDRGYYRALLVKELELRDETVDYSALIPEGY